METFTWLMAILAGSVAITAFARRIGAPYPALLAVAGGALALAPFAPHISIPPDLALALFVAPILLDAGYDTSPRDLRDNWAPVAGLVFVAVGLTAAAVAWTAHALVPSLPWAAAAALGAIVAPPDASAATSILRQLKPPHRILVILEGESLLNDVTALLLFRFAVGAVAAGGFSPGAAAPIFLAVAVGSVVLGYGIARGYGAVLHRISDPPSAIVMQFVGAFGTWIIAEHLHLSPILTVVAMAITTARTAPQRTPASLRLPAYAVWDTAVFLVNVLAFALMGFQVRPIVEKLTLQDAREYGVVALAVLAAVFVVRIVWVMGFNGALRLKNHVFGVNLPARVLVPTLRGGALLSWCGMRGVVTVAAALSLPPGFPQRDLIQVTAFAVVLGTLLIQGLTLKPLMAVLGLEDDTVEREAAKARKLAVKAALAVLDGRGGPAADALRREYQDLLREAADTRPGEEIDTDLDALRREAVAAQRQTIVDLRSSGEIGDDAFHIVEAELDVAEVYAAAVGGVD
jgi:CPA1 family monovalent cation:H+ antiporter